MFVARSTLVIAQPTTDSAGNPFTSAIADLAQTVDGATNCNAVDEDDIKRMSKFTADRWESFSDAMNTHGVMGWSSGCIRERFRNSDTIIRCRHLWFQYPDAAGRYMPRNSARFCLEFISWGCFAMDRFLDFISPQVEISKPYMERLRLDAAFGGATSDEVARLACIGKLIAHELSHTCGFGERQADAFDEIAFKWYLDEFGVPAYTVPIAYCHTT